jgi:hypothetical protein
LFNETEGEVERGLEAAVNPELPILIRRSFLIVVLSAFLLSACGGGGGGATLADDPGAEPAAPAVDPDSLRIRGVDSYSPLPATTDEDASGQTAWFYRVNHGEPLEIQAEEGSFRLAFPDAMLVTFDPDAGGRISDLAFQFTGVVPGRSEEVRGSGFLNRLELLECGETGTLLHAVQWAVNMNEDGVDGEDGQFMIGTQSMMEYEAPLVWLPDCPNLGSHLETAEPVETPLTNVRLAGSVDSWLDGLGIRSGGFEYLQETPESFRVTETSDEVMVLGRKFTDVVIVEWQTLVSDLGCPEDPDCNQWRTVRMWFAKDVGMIRAEGALNFWGEPVDLELQSIVR